MAEEKFYEVTHSVNGWKAVSRDSETIICEGIEKEEVVDCIVQKAKEKGSSRVAIHNREGELLEEKFFSGGMER